MSATRYELEVVDVCDESDSVKSLTLRSPDGGDLPAWEPGAHVDVFLPSGLIRKYSLCGDPLDRTSYRIAVLADPHGRGGSIELHNISKPGLALGIAGPRNRFPLVESDRYLFVAGGVGITPILPMIHEVERRGAAWQLVYGGRSRQSMAFLPDIEALESARVSVVVEAVEGIIDLHDILGQQPPGTAVFCCGPTGLIDAVRDLALNYAQITDVNFEKFSASDGRVILSPSNPEEGPITSGQAEEPFLVECARSGKSVLVPVGKSILDVVLEEVDADFEFDCRDGYCGTCETKVLAGVPEHRDDILNADERAANDVMMICVGRAITDRLVLDI